jgi:hypothetical protein
MTSAINNRFQGLLCEAHYLVLGALIMELSQTQIPSEQTTNPLAPSSIFSVPSLTATSPHLSPGSQTSLALPEKSFQATLPKANQFDVDTPMVSDVLSMGQQTRSPLLSLSPSAPPTKADELLGQASGVNLNHSQTPNKPTLQRPSDITGAESANDAFPGGKQPKIAAAKKGSLGKLKQQLAIKVKPELGEIPGLIQTSALENTGRNAPQASAFGTQKYELTFQGTRLQRRDGLILDLVKIGLNGQSGVRAWVNGRFAGQFNITTLIDLGNGLTLGLETKQKLNNFSGEPRFEAKITPYVRILGNSWNRVI